MVRRPAERSLNVHDDPRSTRVVSQGKTTNPKQAYRHDSAQTAGRGAAQSNTHKAGYSGEYRSTYGYATANSSRGDYGARSAAPQKKKKIRFKRIWKNVKKQFRAFLAKLFQVEDASAKPKQASSATHSRTFGERASATSARAWKTARKGLVTGAKAAARGAYLGVRRLYSYLMKLPPRTLAIGSGAFGLVFITIIVLAIALPGKQSDADAVDQFAAFVALNSETTALESAAMDGSSTQDAAGDTAALETEITEQTVEAADAAVFAGELRSGDNDAVIATIQTRLMELGYMDSDEPTQHFGSLTQSALKTFQRHNGLDDDGICGQATYNLLMSGDAKIYVMQLGDAGPDVEGAQQRLYELGYLDNKANIQGNFGDKTEAAVEAFQSKNGLKADGKVGVKTLEMLYGEDVVSNAYRLGDENRVIKDCQTALKKLGYITFTPDGVMGKATVSAIKAFQQANGLTRDGALGPVTRDMILSGDAQAMVLQVGDYGTAVKTMQTRLAKLNYLSSANATGYFGEITEDAVKAFQKRAGLTADGKVGAVTLTMMNSSSAKKAATTPSSNKESSSGSSSSGSSSSGSSSSGSSSSSTANKTGVEKLVALAESKIGSKYVRGAKGPNTFDCSGFVYWCVKNSGVSLSYMTSVAWRTTSRFQRITSMGSIQRGDVLVFSGETSSTGHVGIYIGGGKMIDASSSEGEVRRSTTVLSSGGYWSKHFICAYRIF